jgi:hypothetical protein
MDKSEFVIGLEALINRQCRENASNTPDFILAQYLDNCLAAFNAAVQQRETWYGRDARPTLTTYEINDPVRKTSLPMPDYG